MSFVNETELRTKLQDNAVQQQAREAEEVRGLTGNRVFMETLAKLTGDEMRASVQRHLDAGEQSIRLYYVSIRSDKLECALDIACPALQFRMHPSSGSCAITYMGPKGIVRMDHSTLDLQLAVAEYLKSVDGHVKHVSFGTINHYDYSGEIGMSVAYELKISASK